MAYRTLPKTIDDLQKLSIADLLALKTYLFDEVWSVDSLYQRERIEILIRQELEHRIEPWINEVKERPND